ncbi:MAG: VIT domain-containing protein [Gemmatales bacterium]
MPVAAPTSSEPIISTLESQASLGVMMTDQGPLPLKSVAIDARIDQLFAGVTVRQGYVNTHRDAIEATYIFPLPDRAAVTRFQAKLGDRLIEGILKERGAARQEYDEAIQQGHRAAIAEEERPNVFTMRVGNIMPGESAEIELTLCMPLAYEEGEATFRFPLVVAPRYIPGKPLLDDSVGLGVSPDTDAVPDASRITPPVLLPGYPYRVQLDIAVSLAQEITQPKVNMPVQSASGSDNHTIWKVLPGQKLDRDFLFRFPVAGDTIITKAMIAPDQNDPSQGTISITIVPPKPSAQISKPKPRRIVFVLDRSGSMEGWKLIAARRALGRMIDTLSPQDHFAIIAFDTQVEQFPHSQGVPLHQSWYQATDVQRFRAIEALATIKARGGTEMARPIMNATEMLQANTASNEDRILVLITDGQAGNEDQILKELSARVADIRIFTLGVDMAVNEGFLRRLAQLGGGATEVVESENRLDEVMQRIHRRIAAPVLRNLSIKLDGITLEAESMVPKHALDLYAEAPVVVQARCALPAEGKITLSASDDADGAWKQELAPVVQASSSLAPCWARTRVRELEDAFATGRNASLDTTMKIVDLSVKYQVLSRFTAYLAIDRSAVVNPAGQPRAILQGVESPAGWVERENIQMCMMAPACDDSAQFSLALPVQESQPILMKYCKRSLGFSPSSLSPARRTSGRDLPVQEEAQIVTDLASYRDRAKQMVTDFDQTVAIDAGQALGKLRLALFDLLADLQTIGAAEKELEPLRLLLLQLTNATQSSNQRPGIERTTLNPLRRFAQVPVIKTNSKRWLSFWK